MSDYEEELLELRFDAEVLDDEDYECGIDDYGALS